VLIAHKIRIYPNEEQISYFAKAFGIARFSFNYGLAKWKEALDSKEKTSWQTIRNEFNAIKHEEFPWVAEVSKHPCSNAFENLGTAMKNFFSRKSKFPRFKKRGIKDSFRIDLSTENTIRVEEKSLKIPKLEPIKMSEVLRFDGKVKQVTVSRRADLYFASFLIEVEENPYTQTTSTENVGIDLGIKAFVTLSDGLFIEPLHALKQQLRKLRKLSKSLSKKVKGSVNRDKAKTKLARLHYRISCIRNDFLHKISDYITKNYGKICMESLAVGNLMKNRRLSRVFADAGMYAFKVMMEYKSLWRGCELYFADRFYPSSKTCCRCGNVKKELRLSERVYKCNSCSHIEDRDVNAAINLRNLIPSA
jgi:putative transposase